jgi:two-component system, chemotaxis family, protein-glutamate methylesterase/glutaminase
VSALRVALADDSAFIRRAVAYLLDGEPDIQIVGSAARGEDLLASLDLWNPEAVVLNLSMPGLNGLEGIDTILRRRPRPVVLLLTPLCPEAPLVLEALHRGPVDFIDRQAISLMDFDRLRQALLDKLRGLCAPRPRPFVPAAPGAGPPRRCVPPEAILLGASTGGPPAIEQTLGALGAVVEVPILVAQHMPAGYTRAFAERLDALLPLSVREAREGMLLEAGTVTLAPGGLHLQVVRCKGLRSRLSRMPGTLYQPSVDVLFESAAEHLGAACIAVLLTGMGHDGAEGMLRLAGRGACTIAQDEASSFVFGMPRAAIEAGGAQEVLPLAAIAGRLREILEASYCAGGGAR